MTACSLTQAKRAYRLFKNNHTSKEKLRYNVRNYLRELETLGDKWVLAKKSNYSARWCP